MNENIKICGAIKYNNENLSFHHVTEKDLTLYNLKRMMIIIITVMLEIMLILQLKN